MYLSLDGVIDSSDTLLSIRSLTGLQIGQTDSANGQVTLPTNLSSGTYQVLWLADDLEQIDESNESNNVQGGLGALVVGSGGGGALSELVPESITFSPAVQDVGQNILISESVRNAGLNRSVARIQNRCRPRCGFDFGCGRSGLSTAGRPWLRDLPSAPRRGRV